MSKKKRNAIEESSVSQKDTAKPVKNGSTSSDTDAAAGAGRLTAADKPERIRRWQSSGGFERLAIIGFSLLLISAVAGASGLGNKLADAFVAGSGASGSRNQLVTNGSQASLPNPAAPATGSTPQLAREYIYAGNRMLAVEDAGANAVAPADLAVWRPDTGYWYVLGGAGGSQQVFVQWGANGDKPVPGDYDGDGKTDFSVFRPAEGNWYIQRSSDGALNAYTFGISGDELVPADYDGDGRTDAAVFRQGVWYILRSSDGGVTSQQFGLSSDKPAAADYDGDGKADLAVWRATAPSTFYVMKSSNGQWQSGQLGQAGDVPVSSDYDGDGKADYAVKSGANWSFLYSSSGQTQTISWQQQGDLEVPNDYDGDGKTDIAVWRAATGDWYIRNSSTGQLRYEHWGQAGDFPVPAFYRR
jgi:hypothetical protein